MTDRNPQVKVLNRIEEIIVGFLVFFGRFAITTWQLGRRPANGARFAADTSGAPLATRPFTYLVVSSFFGSQFVRKVINTYDHDPEALARDTLGWLEGVNVTTVLIDSLAALLVVGGLAYLLGFLLTLRVATDQRSEKRQTAVRLVCYGTGFQFVLLLVWGSVWIALIYVWEVVLSWFSNADDIITLWILIGVALVILLSSTRIYWHGLSSLWGSLQLRIHRISRAVLSVVLSTTIFALASVATFRWLEITHPSRKELELTIATFSVDGREFSSTVYITNLSPVRLRLMDVTEMDIEFYGRSGKFLGRSHPKVQTVDWETKGTNALVIDTGDEGFVTLKGSGFDPSELEALSRSVHIEVLLQFRCATKDGVVTKYARGNIRLGRDPFN